MIAKLKAWWAALWPTEETKVETQVQGWDSYVKTTVEKVETDVKSEEQKLKV